MLLYAESLSEYKRLVTREVKIGNLLIGAGHPVRVQTMTTTDTMDTKATVEQAIRCIEAGAELVRITAPSKKEAENLRPIRDELRRRGYDTPLVADIHFTPNAAEIAATIVEKVRVNPGNYVDKKKFEQIEYTDIEYAEEIERIRERFTPLVRICREHGTAMRIGTNHGSLSDRIMSRYGDTANGMVESAMEFLRIARSEDYHNIVLSMKSSNPQVMVQAYRLLINHMMNEFGECYPLHLGVTEAGDGEDGRIKSAVGIGTLLEDGIGDTIRVSLTEDPELEIPVCKHLVNRYQYPVSGIQHPASSIQSPASSIQHPVSSIQHPVFSIQHPASSIQHPVSSLLHPVSSIQHPASSIQSPSSTLPYDPFNYQRRQTIEVGNIGGKHVPVVVADMSKFDKIIPSDLEEIGYRYDAATDKWLIGDAAADYIFSEQELDFELPGTVKVLLYRNQWASIKNKDKYVPLMNAIEYLDEALEKSSSMNFVMIDCFSEGSPDLPLKELFARLKNDHTAVACLSSTNMNSMQSIRRMFIEFMKEGVKNPAIIICDSTKETMDENLIHYAVEAGALLIDGFCDGVCFGHHFGNRKIAAQPKLLNSISFGILQATRTRISKTEYISCPSCGRTLFDLQETTARIRAVTNHLKGVKIAIMGCIVNGPGEMADADFGYVGSGVGKITLYRGKEVVKRNVPSEIAVEELVNLLKENDAWVEVQGSN